MRSLREIHQNNKLIAKFIGGKVTNEIWTFPDFPIKETCLEGDFSSINLDFDNDWNRLMLVIEYIENGLEGLMKVDFQINNKNTRVLITLRDYTTHHIEIEPYTPYTSKINYVYNSVLAFIKWYNKFNKSEL